MPSSNINIVKLNDGEGIDFNDFNDMQSFMHAFFTDTVMRGVSEAVELGRRLDTIALTGRHIWAENAGAACPLPDAGARTVKSGQGLIMVCDTVVDGLTRAVKSYYLNDGEISLTLAADPTNPRFASVYLKLDEVDADTQTRDFKDATTDVITSTTFPKKRRFQLATPQVVYGTPAATPTVGADPGAGWHLWCHVLIPAAHASAFISGHIADMRLTLRQRAVFVPASQFIDNVDGTKWPIQYASDGERVAGNASDKLRCIPPLPPGARLLGVRIQGTFGANVVFDIKRGPGGGSQGPGLANGLITGALPTGRLLSFVGDTPLFSGTTFKGGPYWQSPPPYYPPQSTHGIGMYFEIDPHGAGDTLYGAWFYFCE